MVFTRVDRVKFVSDNTLHHSAGKIAILIACACVQLRYCVLSLATSPPGVGEKAYINYILYYYINKIIFYIGPRAPSSC